MDRKLIFLGLLLALFCITHFSDAAPTKEERDAEEEEDLDVDDFTDEGTSDLNN